MEDLKHYDDAAIALIDARGKSNTHRINELTEHQVALDRLVTSVEVLATKQETVEGDVKEIKELAALLQALMGLEKAMEPPKPAEKQKKETVRVVLSDEAEELSR